MTTRPTDSRPRSGALGLTLVLGAVLAAPLLAAWARGGTSMPMTTRPEIFSYLALHDDVPAAALQIGLGVLGAIVGRRLGGAARAATWIADHVNAVALATIVGCGLLAVVAYQRYPLAMDEYAPLFQARVFAAGRLAAHYEPAWLDWFFYPPFLGWFFGASRATGEVAQFYWPGLALAFVPFVPLRAEFLLNPILAGASVRLLSTVVLRFTDGHREAAGWAIALLVSSPAFLINGASFYSMNAHLFANLAFVALISHPTRVRLAGAGAVGAWACSLHNPLPHLAFVLPWWLRLVARPGRSRLVALAAGYVAPGLVLVIGWQAFRSQLSEPPPSAIFVLPNADLFAMRAVCLAKMAVWAPFGLVPLAIVGALRTGRAWGAPFWAASALVTFGAYLFVQFSQGHGWGYRYFHSAYFTLPILASFALVGSDPDASTGRAPALGRALKGATLLWILTSLFVLVPQRAVQVRAFISAHRAQVVDTSGLPGTFVHFIRPAPVGYYSQDLIRNEPFLRDRELFVMDHGPEDNGRFLRRFAPDAVPFREIPTDVVYWARPPGPRAPGER